MAATIKISAYANSDDVFVAWAPSDPISECRGFFLERGTGTGSAATTVVAVENRVGFAADKPKAREHRPSNVWPFQRFNWTDHATDVGDAVRYRVTAMIGSRSERPFTPGPHSPWTPLVRLTPDAGDGFSCYFNRGLVISQFVRAYLDDKGITTAKLKTQLKNNVDPKFRGFLQGDLGNRIFALLKDAKAEETPLHACLYELADQLLEDGLIGLGEQLHLILANGSEVPDSNEESRQYLNDNGIQTIDRLLAKSKGLGHNKFVVIGSDAAPTAVWTGSTNWSTTGLCTQINNGLLLEDKAVASHYLRQWERIRDASPPAIEKADMPKSLVAANDKAKTFSVGQAEVTVQFTRTSDGRDMDMLRDLIASAKKAILFLMFTPGKNGIHIDAGRRAEEEDMYVRGVVSTLGTTKEDNDRNVLDVKVVSSDKHFKTDRYSVVQPQGVEVDLGGWVAEVTRRNFLSQIGHAIVHSKVLVIDPLGADPVVVTGSHNFSDSASAKNDENLIVVRGHVKLAQAYAAHIMSVYQHYRFRSYLRETLAAGKTPWSYLDDNDVWLRNELKSKQNEIDYWTP